MTTLGPTLLPFLLAGLLIPACVAEEGYTPIGEEQQDEGGARFELSFDNPEASVFFTCDQECDLLINYRAPSMDLPDDDGLHFFTTTLVNPEGFGKTEELIAGGANFYNPEQGDPYWRHPYTNLPAGSYEIKVKIGTSGKATLKVDYQHELAIEQDWPNMGVDCTEESSDACTGENNCVQQDGGDTYACTAICFFDEQCPESWTCDGLFCEPMAK